MQGKQPGNSQKNLLLFIEINVSVHLKKNTPATNIFVFLDTYTSFKMQLDSSLSKAC